MKYFKRNLMRYLMQWGVLAAIIYFTRGSMACSMTIVQILIGGMLTVGVILFGKLFCSYVCPLGIVNELFVKFRRRVGLKKFVIEKGSVLDKILRLVKYVLLFVVFYVTLSSSVLFCKNFCLYYAFATGFKGEFIVYLIMISIGILIVGNIFVDMFWCKYVCPLGALSNIFRFTVMFVGAVLIYCILHIAGLEVPWIVLVIVCVALGYILEIVYGKAEYNISMLHVHNNLTKCNSCGVCVRRCPYHIKINEVKRVVDIDCNLCCECVNACERDALKMGICNTRPGQNEIRGRWIPPLLTILLFVIALYLGNKMELPIQTNPEKIKEGIFTPNKSIITPDSTNSEIKVDTISVKEFLEWQLNSAKTPALSQ